MSGWYYPIPKATAVSEKLSETDIQGVEKRLKQANYRVQQFRWNSNQPVENLPRFGVSQPKVTLLMSWPQQKSPKNPPEAPGKLRPDGALFLWFCSARRQEGESCVLEKS